jgi:cob(I)alamin adenosyltransferase
MAKITTKVGDGGSTYLLGGQKIRKDAPRVEAYGQVDELNSLLGWIAVTAPRGVKEHLETVQRELFILGAELATPPGARPPRTIPHVTKEHIRRLEKETNLLEPTLPPLAHFILPGGAPTGAALHLARAVCRRAERAVVAAVQKRAHLAPVVYLNRLSDYLFTLARAVNRRHRKPEPLWIAP